MRIRGVVEPDIKACLVPTPETEVVGNVIADRFRIGPSLVNVFYFLANVNPSSCSLYVVVRPSVCRLSSDCLSVTFVRPTQAIEIFGTVSSPFGTLAIC